MTSSEQTPITLLMLKRYRAGELDPQTHARVTDALGASAQLRAAFKGVQDEQAVFEREIPFDRFVGGVRRAQRHAQRPRNLWMFSSGAALAMAAAGLVLLARPLTTQDAQSTARHSNRSKGDAPAIAALVHVAGASATARVAEPGAPVSLQPEDRVRLELRQRASVPALYHFAVVSLDDLGEATAIYPEAGTSLTWPKGVSRYLLPDGLAFDGQGRENLFVALSLRAFTVETLSSGLKVAWRKHGALDGISAKDLPTIAEPTLFVFPFHKP